MSFSLKEITRIERLYLVIWLVVRASGWQRFQITVQRDGTIHTMHGISETETSMRRCIYQDVWWVELRIRVLPTKDWV